jgi:UDP-2,3-diacylglucosamine pyrophosphatase LpxH
MWKFDAVVVSDLHLGARNSRTSDFLHFLETVETDMLVVNGDLFDSPRLRGLEQRHVEVLAALRRFAAEREVRWILGNHDPSPDWFQAVLGIRAEDEIELEIGGLRYLICHGHRWDSAMHFPQCVIETADAIYRGCQWLDPTHRIARYLKYKSKQFLRVAGRMRRKALTHARAQRFDGICVGHTHMAGDFENDGVRYFNSGCWTESPATFIGVRDGRPCVYSWDMDVLPEISRGQEPPRDRRRAIPLPAYAAHGPLPAPELAMMSVARMGAK